MAKAELEFSSLQCKGVKERACAWLINSWKRGVTVRLFFRKGTSRNWNGIKLARIVENRLDMDLIDTL